MKYDELTEEDKRYEELAKEAMSVQRTWNNREKKRNRTMKKIEQLKKKDVKPNNLSRKDEYLVYGWLNGDKDQVFTSTIAAGSFHGNPSEYEEIKEKARKEHKCKKVNILRVTTK
jgi:hypothetical protein